MGDGKIALRLAGKYSWWLAEKALVPFSLASSALTTISPKQGMLEKAIDGSKSALTAAGNLAASLNDGGLRDVATTLQDKVYKLSQYNVPNGTESIANFVSDPLTTAYAAAIALTVGLGAHYASKPIRKKVLK